MAGRGLIVLCGLLLLHSAVGFNGDSSAISVSGVSSGGFAAVQFHVSYSSKVMGAGIVAGGPYWCANDDLGIALSACESLPELIILDILYYATKYAYELNSIDNPTNLASSNIYLFSGTRDTLVTQGVMVKLQTYYQNYIPSTSNYHVNFSLPAEHCFPTDDYGNACTFLGSPYINNCGYDAAGELLTAIYGTLSPKVDQIPANIMKMKTQDFTPNNQDPSAISMDDTFYVYVPAACKDSSSSKCKVHLALHGCNQSVSIIGDIYYTKTGYNGWAEANDIIVIYPQTIATPIINPLACWDWWGYSSEAYATQEGPQMATMNNMVQHFLS